MAAVPRARALDVDQLLYFKYLNHSKNSRA